MTLTKFMARSTWVAYAFELGKLLKCHLKGKASRKLANGQNIEDSEKRKRPKGFICPCTGIKYHNIHTCLLTSICSRSQVSVYRTIGPLVIFTAKKGSSEPCYHVFIELETGEEKKQVQIPVSSRRNKD